MSDNSEPVNLHQDQNFSLHAIGLLNGAEALHNQRIQDLNEKHGCLNEKISALKAHLEKCYNHVKKGSKENLDLSSAKGSIIDLWNEWKEELKTTNSKEYNHIKKDLESIDFSNLDIDKIYDEIIPELEKIQRHHEFKFTQIPSTLRLFIELFSILVEILKEIPKKQDELLTHTNQKMSR